MAAVPVWWCFRARHSSIRASGCLAKRLCKAMGNGPERKNEYNAVVVVILVVVVVTVAAR